MHIHILLEFNSTSSQQNLTEQSVLFHFPLLVIYIFYESQPNQIILSLSSIDQLERQQQY